CLLQPFSRHSPGSLLAVPCKARQPRSTTALTELKDRECRAVPKRRTAGSPSASARAATGCSIQREVRRVARTGAVGRFLRTGGSAAYDIQRLAAKIPEGG